jgi:hypothetical protein
MNKLSKIKVKKSADVILEVLAIHQKGYVNALIAVRALLDRLSVQLLSTKPEFRQHIP